VTSLPESISNLTTLSALDVMSAKPHPNDCEMQDLPPRPARVELPAGMSRMTALQALSLSSRKLPAAVRRLPALNSLRVSLLGVVAPTVNPVLLEMMGLAADDEEADGEDDGGGGHDDEEADGENDGGDGVSGTAAEAGGGGDGRSLHGQLLALTRLSGLTSLRLHHCGSGCANGCSRLSASTFGS